MDELAVPQVSKPHVVDIMAEWGCLDVWCALSLVTAPKPKAPWVRRLKAASKKDRK